MQVYVPKNEPTMIGKFGQRPVGRNGRTAERQNGGRGGRGLIFTFAG